MDHLTVTRNVRPKLSPQKEINCGIKKVKLTARKKYEQPLFFCDMRNK